MESLKLLVIIHAFAKHATMLPTWSDKQQTTLRAARHYVFSAKIHRLLVHLARQCKASFVLFTQSSS